MAMYPDTKTLHFVWCGISRPYTQRHYYSIAQPAILMSLLDLASFGRWQSALFDKGPKQNIEPTNTNYNDKMVCYENAVTLRVERSTRRASTYCSTS